MEAAPNKRSYIRLAALRSLLLGIARATVCQQFCRTDRMVRLWIELFNRGGIDALITRPKPGRPRKVKLERVRDRLLPVLENPATAGQVHWTGVKLHGYLKEQLSIDLGEHIRQNVIGAVAPPRGELFSLIVDGVDTDVFQVLPRCNGPGRAPEGRRAPTAHPGQRLLAQVGAPGLTPLRAEVPAGLLAGLQPH